jgi:hypothetical protein
MMVPNERHPSIEYSVTHGDNITVTMLMHENLSCALLVQFRPRTITTAGRCEEVQKSDLTKAEKLIKIR